MQKHTTYQQKMSSSKFKPCQGTKDFTERETLLFEKARAIVKEEFALRGAQFIRTPFRERTEVLLKKYEGTEDRISEIFNIASNCSGSGDGGGGDSEKQSQRYDLTVPLSRYLGARGLVKGIFSQVGLVSRNDQPNMKGGRFTEFYQADIDWVGNGYVEQLVNAEALSTLYAVLQTFRNDLGLKQQFAIKINSRNFLQELCDFCEIPLVQFKSVCRSIDKLDKREWTYVSAELLEKGLSTEMVEQLENTLKRFKKVKWTTEGLQKVEFLSPSSRDSLMELNKWLKLKLKPATKLETSFQIDFSLARGLDYYTGIIYEAVLQKSKVGSIAAGGRYDRLIEVSDTESVQSVGLSIGIDRLLTVLPLPNKRECAFEVWVIQATDDDTTQSVMVSLFEARVDLVQRLRLLGIKAGTEPKMETSLSAEMKYVSKQNAPFVIFIGEKELRDNKITLKLMDARQQLEMIEVSEAIPYLKRRIVL